MEQEKNSDDGTKAINISYSDLAQVSGVRRL